MDQKQFSQRVAGIPSDNPNKPMWEYLDQQLQTLGAKDPAVAAMRQEIDTLKATPTHSAGLCNATACQPCQDARSAVAHQTEDSLITLFDDAARRYGLESEVALLAEAVKRHRAEDAQWTPHRAARTAPDPLIEITR